MAAGVPALVHATFVPLLGPGCPTGTAVSPRSRRARGLAGRARLWPARRPAAATATNRARPPRWLASAAPPAGGGPPQGQPPPTLTLHDGGGGATGGDAPGSGGRDAGLLPDGTVLHGPAGAYAIEGVLGVGGGSVTYAARVVRAGPPDAAAATTGAPPPPPPPQRGPPPPLRPGAPIAVGDAVAVKALPLRRLGGWKSLDLFRREAEVLASVAHPAIPAYIDAWADEPPAGDLTYCLVQSRAPGVSLQALLGRAGRLGAPEVVALLRQLLGVADYLGGLAPPVVHRDVKPENVVVALGAPAAAGSAGATGLSALRGAVDGRSDLYAIGATVLAALVGADPSTLPSKRLRVDVDAAVPPSPSAARRALVAVVQRLVEPAPEDRYPTAAAALAALDGALAAPPPAPPPLVRAGAAATGVAPAAAVPRRPPDTSVVVERDAGSLTLVIPASVSGALVSTASFTAVWGVAIGAFTASAVAAAAPVAALFSVPFWVAGGDMARKTAALLPAKTTLTLRRGGDDGGEGGGDAPGFVLVEEGVGRAGAAGAVRGPLDGLVVEVEAVSGAAPPPLPAAPSPPVVGSAADWRDRDGGDGWGESDARDAGATPAAGGGELVLVEADGTTHVFGAALSEREKAYVAATVESFLAEGR
ncbi:hypothetical protein BU14_0417s0002 [Porphyra umbilicalis]|uniref:non-specific serine/threonine protein kinase n=1 Tax=Porphyra umbilicalis TaxID=2786 RepID=A0A1X6NVM0_PORUM|nr:hypothetical protein BU14_0417s0002 [Porphyra umbilicalis]|eukprot:OSX72627.1 hypothetical protein BU14_0417s0002 [Porphyra umbilicalis]